MTLTQVVGTNQPARVVVAGDPPGVLVNRDIIIPAFTSPDRAFNSNDPTASIHDALVGVSYDGTKDVYALVQPGQSIVMDYVENAQFWAPGPAQIAASIAASGIFSLANSTSIFTTPPSLPITIPGSSTAFLPGLGVFAAISQLGYDGYIEFHTAAATQTRVSVLLNWEENGVSVGSDEFDMWAGSAAAHHFVYFSGPTKGTGLNIAIAAEDPNTVIVDNIVFNQNSRNYTQDRWHSLSGTFVAGATVSNPNFDVPARFIATESAVIAASTTNQYALPLWNGRVRIRGGTTSGTTDMQIFITAPPNLNAGGVSTILNVKSDATGGIQDLEFFLPRSQCLLNLRNGNVGSAETLDFSIIALDY